MECMSLLGVGVCAPDAAFRANLPFPAFAINRETIPPLLRRRSSQAMQMAFSAASAACEQAQRSPSSLPAIFASVAGEINTTDQICNQLVKADGVMSPSAFHNSVQNTVAGYWSIAQQCTQPATALAAGSDTLAMALLEAWCQLACQGGELLLVCYDEAWPGYLVPGCGNPAFAYALLLAAGTVDGRLMQISRPQVGESIFPADWTDSVNSMPILAAIPLLEAALTGRVPQAIALSPHMPGWQVHAGVASAYPKTGDGEKWR
ncbi:beta-ketoacyl synthase chain length factor [Methylomonas sp. OY6]|uniref:Beta-ketoacyl synthase chain length factor n=1 Tax=Methylomonas defluvii TaxID=3045149 RepID=A0ABU4UKX4_9GAMM|nr:beta-ketoacyl synthase chain length factor [Methylomonas sp. OY6]MDX8130145.1 beta-ketoacyl synthase chain length factor [Methylomonas sp. OY6]